MPASPRRTQLPTSKTPVANKPGKVAAPKAQPIKKPATPQYSNSGQTGGAPNAMAPMAPTIGITNPIGSPAQGAAAINNLMPPQTGSWQDFQNAWGNDTTTPGYKPAPPGMRNDPYHGAAVDKAFQSMGKGFFANPSQRPAAPPAAPSNRPAYANEAGRLNAQLQSTSITPEQRARIEQRMKFKGYDANTPAMSSAQLQQSAPKAFNRFFPATGPVSPTTGLATQPGAPVLDRSTVTYQNEQPDYNVNTSVDPALGTASGPKQGTEVAGMDAAKQAANAAQSGAPTAEQFAALPIGVQNMLRQEAQRAGQAFPY